MLGGRQNRVPLIVGHNTEEVGLTVPAIPTEEAYRQRSPPTWAARCSDNVIAQIYPVARYGTPRNALVQVLTDARFGCQARAAARGPPARRRPRRGATSSRSPWSRAPPPCARSARGTASSSLYVFQNIDRFGAPAAPTDLAVERSILGFWTRFAATGDPGGDTPWPRYASGMEPTLRIAATPAVEPGWRNAECDGWDTVLMITPPAP
jgi:para-nitrobenzyl esterase